MMTLEQSAECIKLCNRVRELEAVLLDGYRVMNTLLNRDLRKHGVWDDAGRWRKAAAKALPNYGTDEHPCFVRPPTQASEAGEPSGS